MEKRPDHIVPQKSDKDPMYVDVKTGAQAGDNDTDRVVSHKDDEAKQETDKAYLEQQNGSKP